MESIFQQWEISCQECGKPYFDPMAQGGRLPSQTSVGGSHAISAMRWQAPKNTHICPSEPASQEGPPEEASAEACVMPGTRATVSIPSAVFVMTALNVTV